MARKKQQSIKSQKGQNMLDLSEDQARAHLEKLRWPDGPCCVECGSVNVFKLNGESTRPGVIKCRDCKAQFTVTVGTVLEDSHIPLSKWVKGFHLMASSKKGISALQLMRNLGLGSYKTAWHMAHRIRYAMSNPNQPKLGPVVQVDETYVGGSPRQRFRKQGETIKSEKTPVVALVETDGNVRSGPVDHVDSNTLYAAMRECVDRKAIVVTDEHRAYIPIIGGYYADHQTVNHSRGQYVNEDGFTTNTAESYFALLKRGVYGTFHHISKQHLHRYCNEFDFRWNGRKITDAERRDKAIRQIEGKRLFYKQPAGEA